MRFSVLRVLSVLVVAVLAVTASACSHDELRGGSQNLAMTYTPVPGTLGTGRFDEASFIFKNIRALPADPAEAALYGPDPLLLRFEPFTANLTLTTPVPYSNITLSQGTYIIKSIEFAPLVLVDSSVITPDPVICINNFAVLDRTRAPGIPDFFLFTNPPSLTFTIQPGQSDLALTVDVPGLIAGYEAAFTCTFVPCPGCPVNPVPTLTGFDQTKYRNALINNITFQ